MSYRVELTSRAEEDLAHLPERQVRLMIDWLRRLGENAETINRF